VEGAEEAARDEVVEAARVAAHVGARQHAGGHDREVVRDAGVVEHALGVEQAVPQQALRAGGVVGDAFTARGGELPEHLVDRRAVVVRQAARIGARVGEDLVRLVTSLRGTERPARAPAEAAVALALQAREIEQRRRALARGLARFARERRTRARGRHDRVGARAIEDAVVFLLAVVALAERRVEPLRGVGVIRRREGRRHAPERARYVREHLELLVDEQREGRRLHAARRPRARLLAALQALGERARRVHADQPVRVRAALGGLCEALELLAGHQLREAAANRILRHRLQPEPLDRLARLEVARDLAEDQLALAAGVAGVDEAVHVVALRELLDHADAVRLPLLLLELERLGQDREHVERPALVLVVDLFRLEQLEQVPDREGHDEAIALPVALVLGESAQRRRDVARDARLLRDHESLGHRSPHPSGFPPRPQGWRRLPILKSPPAGGPI